MITENVSTLQIHKLTQEQYESALENGELNDNSIYLTPTIIKDYAFKSDLETKADLVDGKIPLEQLPDNIGESGGLTEVKWNDIKEKPETFLPTEHNHNDLYYNKSEIDSKNFLTSANLTDYAKTSDLSLKADLENGIIPSSQIPEEYITKSELDNEQFAKQATFGNYYTKTEINDYLDDYLKSIPDEYITESELAAEKFLKENSLDNFYNKENIDNKISTLEAADSTMQKSIETLSQTIEGAQTKSNLVQEITTTSNDSQYPSAQAVRNKLEQKQDKLTFDDQPLLNSTNPVTSEGIKTALDKIQAAINGKYESHVFDTYEILYKTLTGKNLDGTDLNLSAEEILDRISFLESLNDGDVFLIKELEVPDYWWEKQPSIALLSEYYEKDIIVDGYGAARILETTKVELDDYALKTDLDDYAKMDEISSKLVSQDEKNAWNNKSDFSGNYNDLDNKPSLSAVATSGNYNDLTGTPALATVATSGSYNDLSNKPTIPTIPSSLPADGGNADTVDNKHASDFAQVDTSTWGNYKFRIASEGDTGMAGYITFIV